MQVIFDKLINKEFNPVIPRIEIEYHLSLYRVTAYYGCKIVAYAENASLSEAIKESEMDFKQSCEENENQQWWE